MAIKIGCGSVVFRKYPLEKALEAIREAGYEWVEVQATAPFCPHVDPESDDPQQLGAMIGKLGFKGVTALWSGHGAVIPDELSVPAAKAAVRWAREAGIPVVHLGDGYKPDGMPSDEAFELLIDRLEEIVDEAVRFGIQIGLEPHGTFSLTAEGLRRILNRMDCAAFGVNYDMANIHRAAYVESDGSAASWRETGREGDEVAVLRSIVGRVIHVHAKDINGRECVALGDGTVHVDECIDVLREHGYHGAVSLETEGNQDFDAALGIARKSFEYLAEKLHRRLS